MNSTKTIMKTSELALMRCLPDSIIDDIGHGRLRNKCCELRKHIDAELARIPLLTESEKKVAYDKIVEFGKNTGWDNKQKHIITLASFILEIIENSDFEYDKKITENLNDIFEYFERVKDARIICCTAGKIAHEKWDKLFEDYRK